SRRGDCRRPRSLSVVHHTRALEAEIPGRGRGDARDAVLDAGGHGSPQSLTVAHRRADLLADPKERACTDEASGSAASARAPSDTRPMADGPADAAAGGVVEETAATENVVDAPVDEAVEVLLT